MLSLNYRWSTASVKFVFTPLSEDSWSTRWSQCIWAVEANHLCLGTRLRVYIRDSSLFTRMCSFRSQTHESNQTSNLCADANRSSQWRRYQAKASQGHARPRSAENLDWPCHAAGKTLFICQASKILIEWIANWASISCYMIRVAGNKVTSIHCFCSSKRRNPSTRIRLSAPKRFSLIENLLYSCSPPSDLPWPRAWLTTCTEIIKAFKIVC